MLLHIVTNARAVPLHDAPCMGVHCIECVVPPGRVIPDIAAIDFHTEAA